MTLQGRKVVFSTDNISRGGKERQLGILASVLQKNKIQVRIISKNINTDNYLSEYRISSDHILQYSGLSWHDKYRSFCKIVTSEKPDYLISWDLQTSIFALLLGRIEKYTFINMSIRHGIRLHNISQYFRSLICILSPYVIANSYAGLAVNNLKPGKRRVVLYNGIEKKFTNNYGQSDIFRKRVEKIPDYFKNPGIVYITVANLVPYKDYFTVLQALHELEKEKHFYYLIIGDGPMRQDIEKLIKSLDLKKRIFLVGKVNNVHDYLCMSDIMIHSSRGEGISNAILEGMFAGLPIIASDVGGIPETVFPESSMLFPYKDTKALLTCLRKADSTFNGFDPSDAKYTAHLAKFSVDSMTTNFIRILESIE